MLVCILSLSNAYKVQGHMSQINAQANLNDPPEGTPGAAGQGRGTGMPDFAAAYQGFMENRNAL